MILLEIKEKYIKISSIETVLGHTAPILLKVAV